VRLVSSATDIDLRKNEYQSINPVSGAVTESYETMSDEEVNDLVSRAAAGYKSWAAKTPEERGKILERVGQLFVERSDELAKIAAEEMGKPVSQGKGEAEFSGEIFEYYARNGAKFMKDEPIDSPDGTAVIETLPIGVILGIMPWNFPFYQVARFAAPNLVLGNTVLLKHSEICPGAAEAIVQLLKDAGVPDDAYINIRATHDQIAEVIGHPDVQGVSLTGSERAASAVGEIAGKYRKRTVFELGGSDPHIVLDTDDIADEVDTVIEARMENTGQACDSNKRIILAEDVFDEFVNTLVDRVKDLVPGDPQEEAEGTFAPLSSNKALQLLSDQVDKAVEQGAKLHVGGKVDGQDGFYFAPAVLTGVTSDMEAYHEEFFGPVYVIYSISSDEEAVELANDTRFGLGAAVFAKDVDRAKRVASQLDVGMSVVNAAGAEGANLPFGGVKGSGYGRELGRLAMDGFVNKRLFFVAE
jgi:succinate-semialdehyde dehydrogenase/glutarate-semialdehyde dehydrogenase